MDVDVIVIGAGQAGLPLATRLAAAGRRVLLAERNMVHPTFAEGLQSLLLRLPRYAL